LNTKKIAPLVREIVPGFLETQDALQTSFCNSPTRGEFEVALEIEGCFPLVKGNSRFDPQDLPSAVWELFPELWSFSRFFTICKNA